MFMFDFEDVVHAAHERLGQSQSEATTASKAEKPAPSLKVGRKRPKSAKNLAKARLTASNRKA